MAVLQAKPTEMAKKVKNRGYIFCAVCACWLACRWVVKRPTRHAAVPSLFFAVGKPY